MNNSMISLQLSSCLHREHIRLGRDGHPIEMHRVWDVVKVRGKRLIAKGESTEDSYSLPLPETVRWPLTVRAAWRFRRANPQFTRWAMGADAPLMPVYKIADVEIGVEPGPQIRQ